jgi:hypothetical protein
MISEQYQLLLQELARVSGLADATGLVQHGRLKIGETDAVLAHEASYDANLLQVRLRLGRLPEQHEDFTKALLEANYVSGYGGECVFSLYPGTDGVVITMRLRLHEQHTAQELWQELSDIARHGDQMWQSVVSVAGNPQLSLPGARHAAEFQRV